MRAKLFILLILSFFASAISSANESDNTNIKFYSGIFDYDDAVGDDKTNLFGIEHRDSALYRDTFLGKFVPITGGFLTEKNSIYIYTGIEAQYRLGSIIFSPSFAPGYYEQGDGKNLGSQLEFKSELNLSLDIFKDSQIGYSYNHISNNDWGSVNPGIDNQIISFSTKF